MSIRRLVHPSRPRPPNEFVAGRIIGEAELKIESYQLEHFEGVKLLWEEVFPNDSPWNRAEASIPAKMTVQPELLLVAIDDGAVVGTAMAGYDGHRGWLHAVAVRQSHRRRGIGTALVRRAEQGLKAIGCAKINLQVRATNDTVVSFYERLGYAIEERISMGKRV
jgi:ribosomal protein S18 acetylase RimI-like enzyme